MSKKIVLKGKKPIINSQGCIKISPLAVKCLSNIIKRTGLSASAIVSAMIIQIYENDMYEYIWEEEVDDESESDD